jgi:hypothetical protein
MVKESVGGGSMAEDVPQVEYTRFVASMVRCFAVYEGRVEAVVPQDRVMS